MSQIQETTGLVNDGATTIATGNADLFARTEAQAASLEQVVASVERVIAFMSDISTASQQQSFGIGQVNDTVKQMETMTTQNARFAEHAESESRLMRAQALKLAELVGSFRLSNSA